jgi:hypothetical protein
MFSITVVTTSSPTQPKPKRCYGYPQLRGGQIAVHIMHNFAGKFGNAAARFYLQFNLRPPNAYYSKFRSYKKPVQQNKEK